MVSADTIAACGVSWPDIRRYGRQLSPHAGAWSQRERPGDVATGVALGMLLIRHLVDRSVLSEQDAIATVAYFASRVTRYARELSSAIESEAAMLHVPVGTLEVVEGKLARMGEGKIFDIAECREADSQTVAAVSEQKLPPLWSHSVCLLPLFLRLRNVESDP